MIFRIAIAAAASMALPGAVSAQTMPTLILADEAAGLFEVDRSTCSFSAIDEFPTIAAPGNLAHSATHSTLTVDFTALSLYAFHPTAGRSWVETSGGGFLNPVDVDVRNDDELFVVDGGNPLALPSPILPAVIGVDLDTGAQSLCFYDPSSVLEAPSAIALEAGTSALVTDIGGFDPFTLSFLPSSLHRISCGPSGLGTVTEITSDQNLVIPVGVEVDSQGIAYVIDLGNGIGSGRLIRIDESQPVGSRQQLLGAGAPLNRPVGIAIDSLDRVLVVDSGTPPSILQWEPGSGLTTVCSGPPMTLPTDVVEVPEPGFMFSIAIASLLLMRRRVGVRR